MRKNRSKLDDSFIKHYNKNSEKGYTFEYAKNLHNDVPFFIIKNKIKNYQKLM